MSEQPRDSVAGAAEDDDAPTNAAEAPPPPPGAAPGSAERAGSVLDSQLREAKKAIVASPQMRGGGQPVYAVPWFLFLGEPEADLGGLLAAATTDSPFNAPTRDAEGEPAWWYWWFLRTMIAIEGAPGLVCDAKDREAWGAVEQAISLLIRNRRKQPMNGIVACVAASTLIGNPPAAASFARRLRGIVDEAYKAVPMRFPVYVVVTGLDRLPGHASTFKPLPQGTGEQVVGHRLDPAQPLGKVPERTGTIMDEILARLHRLRMALLMDSTDSADRRGLFDFTEAVKGLAPGLVQMCDALFSENPYQHQPVWRGLYLTAHASPAARHIGDLFETMLPKDASLAERQ